MSESVTEGSDAIPSPTLEIRNLRVSMSRGGQRHTILEDLNFYARAGEITAVIGRSGSGKSTLAHAIQGLLPDTSAPNVTGSILINKNEIVGAGNKHLRFARQRLVRVISQDPLDALNPTMTLRRQMTETCDELVAKNRLEWAGIIDVERVLKSFPHQISGGERQRVLIAMATAAKVAVVVADEPTTGLDPENKVRVIELLRALADEGVAVVLNTHDHVVAKTADIIALMDNRRIVEYGPIPKGLSPYLNHYAGELPAHQSEGEMGRPDPLLLLSKVKNDTTGVPVSSVVEKKLTVTRSLCGADDAILEMRCVSKAFHTTGLFGSKSVHVLHAIDMSVSVGECVALIGDSGAGKSTFLKIAAGMLRQDAGTVAWKGQSSPQVVFQDPKSFLTPWVPIGEQIVEGLRSKRIDVAARNRRLMEMLDFVELEGSLYDALPSELSVGQCQRAVIARALAVSPQLLLCDEPISALDTPLAASILSLIGRIRRSYGTAIIIATHDLAAARMAADRVYALRGGKLHSLIDMAEPYPEYSISPLQVTAQC